MLKIKCIKPVLIMILLTIFFASGIAYATIQNYMNFQGFLTNNDGEPATDGSYNMTVSLWDGADDSTSSKLWEESHTVTVSRGIYNILLGESVEFPYTLSFTSQYYLGVQVDNGAIMKQDGELIPLTSTWTAFRSKTSGGKCMKQVTQNYAVTDNDDIILASGETTITMPPASTVPNRIFTIKKMDASNSNSITIVTNSTETIDNVNRGTGGTPLIISNQYDEISIISDAQNWISIGITYGTISHEKGGLETDVSSFNGLVKISGGTTSALTVTTSGEALLDDSDSSAQRTTLGIGSIATQESTSVDIDGGDIDGTDIGSSSPSTGKFTTLTSTGSTTIEGSTITLGKDDTAGPGKIVFHDNQNGDNFKTTLQSSDDVNTSFTITLPATDGTTDQVLKTDGSGNLGWISTASSTQLTAGSGLTGGGDLTDDRTFNVGDGDGITVNANDIDVNVDDSTIEINSDTLRLKDSGITDAKIFSVSASKVTTGTLAHERGGMEADVSAYDGLIKVSGGTTSSVTISSAGEALIDDSDNTAQRTTLGLGSMATQNSTSVDIDGGSIDGTAIGASTPSTGKFSTLTTTGTTQIEGANITLGKDNTAGTGKIILHDNQSGTNFTTIIKSAESLSAGLTLTLPSADGTAGQVLKTDGSGNLTWVTASTSSSTSVTPGAGLIGGDSSPLSVNVDDSTIEISGNAVQIKDSGITDAKISNVSASKVTTGTLAHERGGLEADISAYNGMVKISGGTTSAVNVTTAGEALLDDSDAAAQRTTLELGTIATQNSNSVDINGGAIDATPIGDTTQSTGEFTELTAINIFTSSSTTLLNGSVIINSAAGDFDTIIKGNTDASLFVVDASADMVGIGVAAPSSKLDVNGDIELNNSKAIYFGDPDTNGSWRILLDPEDSNHFAFQRRDDGTWTDKFIVAD